MAHSSLSYGAVDNHLSVNNPSDNESHSIYPHNRMVLMDSLPTDSVDDFVVTQSPSSAMGSPFIDRRALFATSSRRWSVIEKLRQQYYCRIRSCIDCYRVVNWKCLLATFMLLVFFPLTILFARSILFNKTFGPETYDFIVVGSGPAGSMVTRKLVDAGARVLLLEAGGPTQVALGGIAFNNAGDSSLNSITAANMFDIPLLWSSILQFPEYVWTNVKNADVLLAKGLGGSDIASAMVRNGHGSTFNRLKSLLLFLRC